MPEYIAVLGISIVWIDTSVQLIHVCGLQLLHVQLMYVSLVFSTLSKLC